MRRRKTTDDDDDQRRATRQADRLLAIADQYEYFCNDFGVPYMSVELPLDGGGSRLETIKIRSRKARLFLVHQYVLAFGKPPSDTALRGVLETLEARASFGGVVHPVYIRHARHNGKIYLDRGTEDGSAYEIDKDGVRIVARPPVRFLRPAGMLPLPGGRLRRSQGGAAQAEGADSVSERARLRSQHRVHAGRSGRRRSLFCFAHYRRRWGCQEHAGENDCSSG